MGLEISYEEQEEESKKVSKKCIVKDCSNLKYDSNYPHLTFAHGEFTGDLCSPCHEYITTLSGKHSQAYRNALTTAAAVLIFHTSRLSDR
jgi:hypothetical protein